MAVTPKNNSPELKCLILEDDRSQSAILAAAVELEGGRALICETIEQARGARNLDHFDLFILDNYLPDGKGADFFSELREGGIFAPCIMMTGLPDVSSAVEMTRDGLFEYFTKPVDVGGLRECLKRAMAVCAIAESSLGALNIVDFSPAMKLVRRQAERAAAHPETTVLLTGETGVGKDVVARLIHQLTFLNKETAPSLVALNCSNLPADMFEAELFGAQKGAYTGAHQNRMGLGEAARGGTLFLDEIAEIPLSLQAKLLQFLETREFRRLGSTTASRFEGRIIAATNKSLENEVRQERFRADLWYRLDVFNIHVPPLRERKEDLSALIEVLLQALANKCRRNKLLIKPGDLSLLESYSFPGNVRELRNIIERSLLQTDLEAKWLEIDPAFLRKARQTVSAPASSRGQPAPLAASIPTTLEEQEYSLISRTLAEESGLIRRTAARLGISHQALLRRLEKWPELRACSK